MSTDTLFRTGSAFHGRHGIKGRESPSGKPRIAFKIDGHSVVYGRYASNGQVSEVIMEGDHATAARLVTLLLQRGVEIETVRKTLDAGVPNGAPDRVLAVVLDRLMVITNGGPRTGAYRWLQKVDRRQSVNRNRTTYGFKHWAEEDEGEYTSVEQFHEAAIALGFRLEPIVGTPNAWINIAEPTKKQKLWRRPRQ